MFTVKIFSYAKMQVKKCLMDGDLGSPVEPPGNERDIGVEGIATIVSDDVKKDGVRPRNSVGEDGEETKDIAKDRAKNKKVDTLSDAQKVDCDNKVGIGRLIRVDAPGKQDTVISSGASKCDVLAPLKVDIPHGFPPIQKAAMAEPEDLSPMSQECLNTVSELL